MCARYSLCGIWENLIHMNLKLVLPDLPDNGCQIDAVRLDISKLGFNSANLGAISGYGNDRDDGASWLPGHRRIQQQRWPGNCGR
jgi:hypothetical protein